MAIDLQIENVICVIQEQNMNEQKREEFLEKFEIEREESLIGFCVLSGSANLSS